MRYAVIGATCAVLNYAIMLAVDAAGGHYLVGTIVAFTTVTPIAYLLHSRFTFGEQLNAKAFARFVAGVASTYPIAIGSLVIFCSGLHLRVAIGAPFATLFTIAWSFCAAHWSIMPKAQPSS